MSGRPEKEGSWLGSADTTQCRARTHPVVPGQGLRPSQELAGAGEHLVGVGRQTIMAVGHQPPVCVTLGDHHTPCAAVPVPMAVVMPVPVAVAVSVTRVGAPVVAGRGLASRGSLLGLCVAAAVCAHQVAEHCTQRPGGSPRQMTPRHHGPRPQPAPPLYSCPAPLALLAAPRAGVVGSSAVVACEDLRRVCAPASQPAARRTRHRARHAPRPRRTHAHAPCCAPPPPPVLTNEAVFPPLPVRVSYTQAGGRGALLCADLTAAVPPFPGAHPPPRACLPTSSPGAAASLPHGGRPHVRAGGAARCPHCLLGSDPPHAAHPPPARGAAACCSRAEGSPCTPAGCHPSHTVAACAPALPA